MLLMVTVDTVRRKFTCEFPNSPYETHCHKSMSCNTSVRKVNNLYAWSALNILVTHNACYTMLHNACYMLHYAAALG